MIRKTLGELDANDLGRIVELPDMKGELRRVEHSINIASSKRYTLVMLGIRPARTTGRTYYAETMCTVDGNLTAVKP